MRILPLQTRMGILLITCALLLFPRGNAAQTSSPSLVPVFESKDFQVTGVSVPKPDACSLIFLVGRIAI